MLVADITRVCDNAYDALTMARVPPGSTTSGRTPVSQSRPPAPVSYLDALRDMHQTLSSWALLISEEAELVLDCDNESMSILTFITRNAVWLAGHPAAEDFVREVTMCTRALHVLYQGRDDRVFCGIHTGVPVWAKTGQKTVMLPSGDVKTVKELRTYMREELYAHVGSASEVAAILRTFYDLGGITAKKISDTHHKDVKYRRVYGLDFVAMDGSRKLFRVGDVHKRFTDTGVSSLQA